MYETDKITSKRKHLVYCAIFCHCCKSFGIIKIQKSKMLFSHTKINNCKVFSWIYEVNLMQNLYPKL